jgi:hypothetical protein
MQDQNPSSTKRWNDVPRGTTDEVSSHVRLDLPLLRRPGRPLDCSASSSKFHDGRAVSEEKHEPASDVDIAAVDSLKALDPDWPIKRSGHATRPAGVAISWDLW